MFCPQPTPAPLPRGDLANPRYSKAPLLGGVGVGPKADAHYTRRACSLRLISVFGIIRDIRVIRGQLRDATP